MLPQLNEVSSIRLVEALRRQTSHRSARAVRFFGELQ